MPAAVIASRGEHEGGVGHLEKTGLSAKEEHGKQLFRHTCASCHNLDAVNARGVTGPDLDEIGTVTKARVLSAIKIGGTGDKRMPSGAFPSEGAVSLVACGRPSSRSSSREGRGGTERPDGQGRVLRMLPGVARLFRREPVS